MKKETIKCEICGAEMTQLGRHLKMKHGINGEEYQLKFPNAPLMSEARRKKILINQFHQIILNFG